MDFRNPSPWGAVMAPNNEFVKLCARSLRDRFNGSVAAVRHPSGEAQLARLFNSRSAKINSLHPACYGDVNT
jgi:hypothetical protein